MKMKLLFIPIFLLTFACNNNPKKDVQQAEEPGKTEQPVIANAAKVQIDIKGMTCTGCENAVKETINEFEGVYSSEADFEKGFAVLEFDSTKVNIAKVEEAINELGYEATGHNRLKE